MSLLTRKKSKKPRDGYYHIKDLMDQCPDCKYYVVYSLRSNGKSYSVLEHILEEYFEHGAQGAIIRRYDTDYKQKRALKMWAPLIDNGLVELYSAGKYNGVEYKVGEWTFIYRDESGEITARDEKPFCYGFSLTQSEHIKSTGYNGVKSILFDEFIARDHYLVDEFVLFSSVLSTIIRRRGDVKIFMMGNTINPYNPYFFEMGLTHAGPGKQKPGSIDIYEYGSSGLQVAVEYAEKPVESYESDKYFAFDNPKLRMVTEGDWELNLYPHCPLKYRPKDIKFIFFILFKEELLQCEVVMFEKYNFLFIHKKTTELQHPEKDLIFDCAANPLYTYHSRITKPVTDIQRKIAWYFAADKVFYQDNWTGEIVRNYIEWAGKGVLK